MKINVEKCDNLIPKIVEYLNKRFDITSKTSLSMITGIREIICPGCIYDSCGQKSHMGVGGCLSDV